MSTQLKAPSKRTKHKNPVRKESEDPDAYRFYQTEYRDRFGKFISKSLAPYHLPAETVTLGNQVFVVIGAALVNKVQHVNVRPA